MVGEEMVEVGVMAEFRIDHARQCAEELVVLRERIFRCGLLKTGHALQAATDVIGYEIADYMERMDDEFRARTE